MGVVDTFGLYDLSKTKEIPSILSFYVRAAFIMKLSLYYNSRNIAMLIMHYAETKIPEAFSNYTYKVMLDSNEQLA